MKSGGGLAILSAIRGSGSTVPVIFMTVHIRPEQTLVAIKLGVDGVVLKDSDPNELLSCIQQVMRGHKTHAPFVLEQALEPTTSAPPNTATAPAHPTARAVELDGSAPPGLTPKHTGY